MRGRLALLTGLAAGYVLGAKAGQERYEEIRQQFNRLMGTEPAQQLQTQVRDVAARASEVTTEGINKAGDKAAELVETAASKTSSGSSGSTSDPAPAPAVKDDKAMVGAPSVKSGPSGTTTGSSGKKGGSSSGPDSVTLP